MIFTEKELEKYMEKGDVINNLLDSTDCCFTSHKWLTESLPKRAIYYSLYGDLFTTSNKKKILDVGGGFSSLSRILIDKHDYHLLDIMAHDSTVGLENFFIKKVDWYEFIPDTYDIVIANDLFPNVDQRLELFFEKYLPTTNEIRMSLTYYNTPKFYITKRIDADEIFCQLSYNGKQLKDILVKFFDEGFEELLQETKSLFSNGRHIKILKKKGIVYESKCNNGHME